MTLKKFSILILLLFFFLSAGYTQACCSGGTPLSGSLGLREMERGGGLLEINYDYNTQHDLVAGSEELSDNPRRRNTHSILLRGGYAFAERWTLIGLVSLVRQEEVIRRQNGDQGRKQAQGIGDAVLFGQYTAISNAGLSLLIGAGAELPIGKTDQVDFETGLPLHPDLQPGRGAWSAVAGARLILNHLFKPNLSFTSNLTYRLTTPADRYDGLQKYEFGNELHLLTGFSDQLFIGKAMLQPALLFLYRHTAADNANGFETPNTGGHWLHLRPALEWIISPVFQIGGLVELPLFRELEGTQLTTSSRFRISLRYIFKKEEKNDLL